MKFRIATASMLALLLLGGLCGCSSAGMGRTLDAVGDAVEERMDMAEDALERSVQTGSMPAALTAAEAEAIALEHAGFTAEQVTGLRTEYDLEDGLAQYEVRFRQGRWEYDYEISAETGAILSWDRDD